MYLWYVIKWQICKKKIHTVCSICKFAMGSTIQKQTKKIDGIKIIIIYGHNSNKKWTKPRCLNLFILWLSLL